MSYLVVGLLLPLAALVGLYAGAVRNRYLLVLNGPKYRRIFLERRNAGRYALISRGAVLLALLRFAAFSLGLAGVSAWCRTRDRIQALVPAVPGMNA